MTDLSPAPEENLAKFGLSAFRPGQREVIEAVLANRDCLCIMPTGGGKSLCYQLPSVAREGTTLVVSPLIALMKDQVDTLTTHGIRAAFINSSLSIGEQRERIEAMARGDYDLVYVAPERLRNRVFLDALATSKFALLAVDEAHCISEWGHDFRPDYARIGTFRERLGNPPTIALTATATPLVQRDIVKLLHLSEPQTFITGFARPNLHFQVRDTWGKKQKLDALCEFLEETEGCGIVYCSTRKRCDEIAQLLNDSDLKREVAVYHAGFDPEVRRQTQERFMSGETPIIVATNAFGMGIDKRDLRFVVHFDLPGTLEAYYQEAGRAGRDGADAQCLLLFHERDREIQEFFIENAYPPRATIAKVYDFLRKQEGDPIELTLDEVKESSGVDVSSEGVSACEKILEKAEVLDRLDTRKNQASVVINSELPTLVELLPQKSKNARKVLRTIENLVGENRGEQVFFSPFKLEAMAEMTPAAVSAAIREIQVLKEFEYIPPFRGRAVRMKVRDVPFSKLPIDFTELDRRKAAEFDKVQRVIDFARSSRCRQIEFLSYFGDNSQTRCGACDNCGGLHRITGIPLIKTAQPKAIGFSGTEETPSPQQRDLPLASEPSYRAVRMALSAVARAGEKVGKGLIVKMLCGSNSKELRKLHLDRLSTYGLLKAWKQEEASELMEALVRVRALQHVENQRFRPVLQLTDLGRQAMRGEQSLPIGNLLSLAVKRRLRTMGMETTTAPVPEPVESEQPVPVELPVRNEEPPRLTPIPAPHIEPARVEPPVRIEKPTLFPQPSAFDRTPKKPPFRWTWELFQRGFPLDEAAEVRNLPRESLLDHLLQAAEAGLDVDLPWFLAAEEIMELDLACRGRAPASLRALCEEFALRIPAQSVRLFAAIRFPESFLVRT